MEFRQNWKRKLLLLVATASINNEEKEEKNKELDATTVYASSFRSLRQTKRRSPHEAWSMGCDTRIQVCGRA